MAKIDLYDPKWVDLVFAEKNKSYGAYQLRKSTSSRNIKALLILLVTAAIVGGYLTWKIQADNAEKERLARMEAMELSRLKEQQKKEREKAKELPKIPPKPEQKVVEQVRETQQFTKPVIKKDELVKEDKQLKQQDKLDEKVAVGTKDQEGTKDRTVEAAKTNIVVGEQAPPPPPAPKQEVSNKVFDVVEVPPSFPGGQGALLSWLQSHVKYPPIAQENGVSGRVVVQFVVERDGSVSGVQVVRSVDPSLDREAARVVSSMPKWTPGKQNGSAVRVKYTVPVTFKLQN